MGFLPEAVRNYLLRLGWAHGDDEIISTQQAIDWFDLPQVGRSASRFDMAKLLNLNAHYIREADDARLVDLIVPRLEARGDCILDDPGKARLLAAMPGLKPRAKTLNELADNAAFYVRRLPLAFDAKAEKLLTPEARGAARQASRSSRRTIRLGRAGARGIRAPLRRGRGRQAGGRRPAAPRRADRVHGLARNFRGHDSAGPTRNPGTARKKCLNFNHFREDSPV